MPHLDALPSIVIANLLTLIICLHPSDSANAASTQPTLPSAATVGSSTTHPPSTTENSAYFREAAVYLIRKNQDLESLFRLEQFNRLSPSGASPEQIKQKLDHISELLAGVSENARNRTDYDEAVKLIFAGAGFAVNRSALGVAAGLTLGESLLQYYDDMIGHKHQSRTVRRRAETLATQRIEAAIFDQAIRELTNTDSLAKFQEYFPNLPFRPGDSKDTINEHAPDFHQFTSILEIKDTTERTHALTSLIQENIEKIYSQIDNDLKETNKNIGAVDAKLSAYIEYQHQFTEYQRQAEVHRVKMEGIRSVLYVATTLIGIADPVAGRRVGAVANTALRVYDAVKAFKAASRLGESLTGFASAALTGNLISAGLSLISSFIDTGPTTDEIILQEIGKLRKQVDQMHRDMHHRFNRVDQKLNQMHETLISSLDALYRYMQDKDDETLTQLGAIRRRLSDQHDQLANLSLLATSQGELVIGRIDAAHVQPCIDRKETFRTSLGQAWFEECLSQIQALATGHQLEKLQLDRKSLFKDVAADFRRFPDRTVSQSLRAFRHLAEQGGLRPHLAQEIVGPDSWFRVADLFDRFVTDWPTHFSSYTGTRYGQIMREHRRAISEFAAAIVSDHADYLRGEKSVLGVLVQEYREGVNELQRTTKALVRRKGDAADYDSVRDRPGRRLGGWYWRDLVYKDLDMSLSSPGEGRILGNIRFGCDRVRLRAGERLLHESWFEGLRSLVARYVEGYTERMLDANMLHLHICGKTKFERNESRSDGRYTVDGRRRYKWDVDIDIRATVQVYAVATCGSRSGEERRVARGRSRGIRHGFSIYTRSDTQPTFNIDTKPVVDEVKYAVDDLRSDIMGRFDPYRRDTACKQEVRSWLERKRSEISRVVLPLVEDSGAVRELEKAARLSNAYLGSWLRIALRDAIPRSDLLTSIVAGQPLFPSPVELLEEIRRGPDGFVWDVPERLLQEIDDVEKVLRSPYLAYVVREGNGDIRLERTRYAGID